MGRIATTEALDALTEFLPKAAKEDRLAVFSGMVSCLDKLPAVDCLAASEAVLASADVLPHQKACAFAVRCENRGDESIADIMEAAEDEGQEFEEAVIAWIKQTLRDHERIIFDGNGYSDEWAAEAERRGLANHKTTADALPCLLDRKNIELFEEFGVLNESEIRSRYEVKLEKYNKLINIEARVMKRMVRTLYLPAIADFARQRSRSSRFCRRPTCLHKSAYLQSCPKA